MNKIIKNLTLAAVAAAAVTLMLQTSIARAGDHGPKAVQRPLRINFEKCVPEGGDGSTLTGTVDGGCGVGTIEFKYLSVLPGASIVRFAGEYKITTPDCSITAVCGGFVDTATGRVVLNGVVTAGPQLGDPVELCAQANATFTCSKGRMIVSPIRQR